MKKNTKYIMIGGTATVALAVVSASAFLTSSDFITNPFNSGTTRGNDNDIEVVEDFRSTITDNPTRPEAEYDDDSSSLGGPTDEYGKPFSGPGEVLPGEKFVKKVRVDSAVNYYQYVRVKVIVDWDDAFISSLMSSKSYTAQQAVDYANSYLEIVFPDKGKDLVDQNWLGGIPRYTFNYITNYTSSEVVPLLDLNDVATTGYLYYKYALAPAEFTEDIITSVKLKANATNEFQNAKFDVIVDAESVQATEDSWYVQWSSDLPPISTPPTEKP